MRGSINPFPQYAFMAWCSVKKKTRGQLYLYLLLSPLHDYNSQVPLANTSCRYSLEMPHNRGLTRSRRPVGHAYVFPRYWSLRASQLFLFISRP